MDEFSQSIQVPSSTHPGTTYPIRANPSLRHERYESCTYIYIYYSLWKELLPETMCKAYVWGLCVGFLSMCGDYVWDRRCDIIYFQSSSKIPIDFLRILTKLDYIIDTMLSYIPILSGRFATNPMCLSSFQGFHSMQ